MNVIGNVFIFKYQIYCMGIQKAYRLEEKIGAAGRFSAKYAGLIEGRRRGWYGLDSATIAYPKIKKEIILKKKKEDMKIDREKKVKVWKKFPDEETAKQYNEFFGNHMKYDEEKLQVTVPDGYLFKKIDKAAFDEIIKIHGGYKYFLRKMLVYLSRMEKIGKKTKISFERIEPKNGDEKQKKQKTPKLDDCALFSDAEYLYEKHLRLEDGKVMDGKVLFRIISLPAQSELREKDLNFLKRIMVDFDSYGYFIQRTLGVLAKEGKVEEGWEIVYREGKNNWGRQGYEREGQDVLPDIYRKIKNIYEYRDEIRKIAKKKRESGIAPQLCRASTGEIMMNTAMREFVEGHKGGIEEVTLELERINNKEKVSISEIARQY